MGSGRFCTDCSGVPLTESTPVQPKLPPRYPEKVPSRKPQNPKNPMRYHDNPQLL